MEPDGRKAGGEWVFILALAAAAVVLLLCVVGGAGFLMYKRVGPPHRSPPIVIPVGPGASSGSGAGAPERTDEPVVPSASAR